MKRHTQRDSAVATAQRIVAEHDGTRLNGRGQNAPTVISAPDRDEPSKPPAELWGLATSIDLYDCDPDAIRDAEGIRRFVVQLCELIEMRRFGDTIVIHFGEDERVAGYSMVQLIETSLISAHFANLTNAVYLDVFSCKMYDPDVVAEFARTYFGASRFIKHVTPRI